jgi:hypothetical protein
MTPIALLGKFFPSCDAHQNYAPWKALATQCCLYRNENPLFSFTSKDYTSLQTPGILSPLDSRPFDG